MAKSVFTKHKLLQYFIFLIIVAAVSIGAAIGCYLYFGHNYTATDLSEYEDFDEKLNLGSSFTLNDILEAEDYTYSWIKSSNVEIDIYALNNDKDYVKTDKVLLYSSDNGTFSVVGVSKGKIVFTDPTDSSVTVTFPFQTKFSKSDTELILKDLFSEFYDDGIVDEDEISIITEINLSTSQAYDISDFSFCRNLTRIIVSSPYEAVSLKGLDKINSGIYFYVTDGLYNAYMNSKAWFNCRDRLFPIVNLEEGNCTLVFEFNNGTMEGMSDDVEHYFTSVSKGKTILVADYELTRIGYTFLGWYTSNDNGVTLSTKIHDDYVFETNTKLYADWSMNEYDIVYYDVYATPPAKQHVRYDEITNISSAIEDRTGYTFLGWTTTKGVTSVEYAAGQTVSKLLTIDGAELSLYAIWAANSYSIAYDANGGLNPPENQENIAFDMDVSLGADIPTRTGYTFFGWSTDKDATVGEYAAGQTVKNLVSDAEGLVTLYAIWAANTYTIKYNANGGAEAPTEQTDLAYGTAVTLRTNVPTWYGRIFMGWSQNQDATTASYAAGGTVSNMVADSGGSITLYAVWELAQFKIQYNSNGGTNTPSTSSYLTYNNPFKSITSSIPSRNGYTFKGWTTKTSGNIEYTSGQDLTAAEVNGLYNGSSYITLYAVWSPKSYTITTNTSNAVVSGVTSGKKYECGSNITVTISFTESDNKTYSIKSSSGTVIASGSSGETKTFTMPPEDVTISASSSSSSPITSCVTSGSLITLADGTKTKVENLSIGENILTYNHFNGEIEESPVIFIFKGDIVNYKILTLHFENNINVEIVNMHGFFDYNLNEYVMFDYNNADQFIGHYFCQIECVDGELITNKVKFLSYEYSTVTTTRYTLITANNINHIVNGLLAVSDEIEGLFNIFALDNSMKIIEEEMINDINTYGLASYEEWCDYLTLEEFNAFNGQYINISIGKGLTTKEKLIALIKKYIHPELT